MLRLRSLLPVSILLLIIGGLLLVPSGPSSWTHVDAQTAPRPAAGDRLFLKLEGIDGEATETDHGGDLQLLSFHWELSRTTDTSVKPVVKPFRIVMYSDRATPLLFRASAVRTPIAKAILTVRSPLGQDYLKWTLGNVFITSFQMEDAAGQARPKVSFDLTVTKIDVEYRQQQQSGGLGPAVKGSWDAKGG